MPTLAAFPPSGLHVLIAAVCLFAIPASAAAHPAAAARAVKTAPDVAADFSALAQQRPWACSTQPEFDPPGKWQGGRALCAWQSRLRMRQWQGAGGEAAADCVSVQARWWAWARGARSPHGPGSTAWNSAWTSQWSVDDGWPEKRAVLIRRLDDGTWRVTEWTWRPSPRAATRRWQQGRWALLLERGVQFALQPVAAGPTREARMLRSVLLANAGSRVAEIGGDILNYQSDGLCLQVDGAAPGQQILQVPFAVDDSRAEQRAAMQLQLARKMPKATWLTPFRLAPAPPSVRSGAKFYATWLDSAVVNSQLWIPTRGDGPLVRVRITTALAPQAATRADAPAVAWAQHVLERELMRVAARWSYQHE